MSSTNITHDPSSPAWSYYLDNTQSVNLTTLNGSTVTLSLSALNQENYISLVSTLLYGFSLGATFITIIVQFIYWDSKKSKRPLFIVNFLALILQFCRVSIVSVNALQQINYGVGEEFIGAYAQYSHVTWTTVFITCGLNPIFYGLVLSSLVLQLRAVFATQIHLQIIVTVVASLAAAFVVACWAGWNIDQLIHIWDNNPQMTPDLLFYDATQAGVTAVVGFTCLILVIKLGLSVVARRKMGAEQFGPIHVLTITFGQCLVIPCILPLSFHN